jgi:hypothetical protein
MLFFSNKLYLLMHEVYKFGKTKKWVRRKIQKFGDFKILYEK